MYLCNRKIWKGDKRRLLRKASHISALDDRAMVFQVT